MRSMTPHIVGLGGSLRPGSSSLAALGVALQGAEAAGGSVELLDGWELDLPLYDDDARASSGVARLVEAVGRADGMIWSSPLYHGTVSGAFKNALDWLQPLSRRDPPFLTATPVGLIATSGGVQGLQAINTMEFVVRALRGWTVPLVVPVAHAYQCFAADGTPRDEAVVARLRMLGREVVAASRQFAA
jgi:FMN reductase